MKQEEFALALNALLPGCDPEAPAMWADFAAECVEHEQFVYFIPTEYHAAVEKWLDATYAGLYAVKQEYGPEIAAKVAGLSCQMCALYPSEMMSAAGVLDNDGDAERISEMMAYGTLETTDPWFYDLPDGAALTAQGPEIDVTCSGAPYGLVQKQTELGYLLADNTALLETERDSFGRYRGGAGIYDSYLAGHSLDMIRKDLEDRRILTVSGGTKWSKAVVRGILQNEKYCGDVLQQKSFVNDCISRKHIRNVGQLPMYLTQDHHEGIVSRDTFNAVKAEFARRNSGHAPSKKQAPTGRSCYSEKYALTGRLVCGEFVNMIFATGDCHGGFQRFTRKHFPQQRQMDRDDYMIILGDFGGVWDGSSEERKQLDWLNEKPFTTLFVTGNHENYRMLRELPVEDWHGGKVQRVRPNILHLMRGQLYDIEGRTFFTMGGATSHDVEDGILDPNAPDFRVQYSRLIFSGRRRFRIIGKSWWPEELPSDEEYTAALDTLERAGWKADYVLTHCAPTSIAQQMSRHYQPDALTDFLELVNNRLEFGYWLFGHYHNNREIDPKHILLWEDIIQLT